MVSLNIVFFSILSYNIFCPLAGGGDMTPYRLIDISNNIGEYNVVMFQESFNFCLFHKRIFGTNYLLKKYLNIVGFKYVIEDEAPSWGQDSGLLIASRYEITDVKYIRYKSWNGRELWTWKGILSGKIHNVSFINTHLQASDIKANGNQLIELQNFIDNNFINNDNIVIGGDFNNNYFIYYEKKRLYDALKNINCKDLFIGNPNSSTKNDSKERLDYLFLCNTNNITDITHKFVDLQISDHIGVDTTFYVHG